MLHVIDTTTLSNFALIKRPELVQIALKGQGVTTAVVLAELKVGESLGLIPACDWSRLPVVQLTPAEDRRRRIELLGHRYDTSGGAGH